MGRELAAPRLGSLPDRFGEKLMGTTDRNAAIEEIARFNEAIDQAIAESIDRYAQAAEDRGALRPRVS